MTLQTKQAPFLGTREKLLLLLRITSVDSEANIHSAPDCLVWDDLVRVRVAVERRVDGVRLLVGDLLLPTDLLCSKRLNQPSHDLTSDPDIKYGQRVVQ
jgi:hypothetical protein